MVVAAEVPPASVLKGQGRIRSGSAADWHGRTNGAGGIGGSSQIETAFVAVSFRRRQRDSWVGDERLDLPAFEATLILLARSTANQATGIYL